MSFIAELLGELFPYILAGMLVAFQSRQREKMWGYRIRRGRTVVTGLRIGRLYVGWGTACILGPYHSCMIQRGIRMGWVLWQYNIPSTGGESMTIQEKIKSQGGFITEADIEEIIAEGRLRKVLVRCGSGRFICAAQYVEHFIKIMDETPHDYVRDVALLVGDPWMN